MKKQIYMNIYKNKKCDLRTIHSKRWILLTTDSFKEALMMLNNHKAKEVRRYYIQLEKIFYSLKFYE
jgi:phage anti-repressor protein